MNDEMKLRERKEEASEIMRRAQEELDRATSAWRKVAAEYGMMKANEIYGILPGDVVRYESTEGLTKRVVIRRMLVETAEYNDEYLEVVIVGRFITKDGKLGEHARVSFWRGAERKFISREPRK